MTKFWKVTHFDFVGENQFGQISLINSKPNFWKAELYKFQEILMKTLRLVLINQCGQSSLQSKLKLLISNNPIQSVSHGDSDKRSEMIIFESILTTFEETGAVLKAGSSLKPNRDYEI